MTILVRKESSGNKFKYITTNSIPQLFDRLYSMWEDENISPYYEVIDHRKDKDLSNLCDIEIIIEDDY